MPTLTTNKAVILAAGRGTRMQRTCDAAVLSGDQAAAADAGFKSMMPVGRPFIDYILDGLKKAGYRRICLVVAPRAAALERQARKLASAGLAIDFAVQHEPKGTAHALSMARHFAGEDAFLAINADNYYPVDVLAKLRSLDGSAVAAFGPEGLCRGNITVDRLRNYALISADANGGLSGIIEKPPEHLFADRNAVLINMNCWRFTPAIFTACDAIPLSPRNEYELPDAVSHAINVLHEPFSVIEVNVPVLDLSTRADVAEVTRRLASVEVRL